MIYNLLFLDSLSFDNLIASTRGALCLNWRSDRLLAAGLKISDLHGGVVTGRDIQCLRHYLSLQSYTWPRDWKEGGFNATSVQACRNFLFDHGCGKVWTRTACAKVVIEPFEASGGLSDLLRPHVQPVDHPSTSSWSSPSKSESPPLFATS